MRAAGLVRLTMFRVWKLLSGVKPVNSPRQSSPFKNTPMAFFNRCSRDQSTRCGRGAKARALIPSTSPISGGNSYSMRPTWMIAGAPVSRETARRKAALR